MQNLSLKIDNILKNEIESSEIIYACFSGGLGSEMKNYNSKTSKCSMPLTIMYRYCYRNPEKYFQMEFFRRFALS